MADETEKPARKKLARGPSVHFDSAILEDITSYPESWDPSSSSLGHSDYLGHTGSELGQPLFRGAASEQAGHVLREARLKCGSPASRDGTRASGVQDASLRFAETCEEHQEENAFEVEMEGLNVARLDAADRATLVEELKTSKRITFATKSTTRSVRQCLSSVYWQVCLSTLLVTDVILLLIWLVDMGQADYSDNRKAMADIFERSPVKGAFQLLATIAFTVDVGLRIQANGWHIFKKQWLSMLDLIVAILILVDIFVLLLVRKMWTSLEQSLYVFLILFQVLRVLRLTRQIIKAPCIRGLKYLTSENRRRFIDFAEDLDLDLTYVTPRVVAMGLPVDSCFMGLCRNRLTEVSRFFDTRHPGKYKIINCCPELPYNYSAFLTGDVEPFNIQDHAPPTMNQFVRYLSVAQPWMAKDPRNIIAVHCKAGKGRTGSLVVAWLIFSRQVSTLQDALNLYALVRTDIQNRGRLQSVETPSQVRYLKQLEDLLSSQTAYVNRIPKPPPVITCVVTSVCFRGVFASKEPAAMRVAIHPLDADGGTSCVSSWSADFSQDTEEVMIDCTVAGDVRVSIFDVPKLEKARAKSGSGTAFFGDSVPGRTGGKHFIAGKEPGCMFFFLFHTAYMGESGEFSVDIGASAGNPGMDKAWKRVGTEGKMGWYHANGRVVVRHCLSPA